MSNLRLKLREIWFVGYYLFCCKSTYFIPLLATEKKEGRRDEFATAISPGLERPAKCEVVENSAYVTAK